MDLNMYCVCGEIVYLYFEDEADWCRSLENLKHCDRFPARGHYHNVPSGNLSNLS